MIITKVPVLTSTKFLNSFRLIGLEWDNSSIVFGPKYFFILFIVHYTDIESFVQVEIHVVKFHNQH